MKKTKRGKGKINNSKKKFIRDKLPVFGIIALFLLCLSLLTFVNINDSNIGITGNVVNGLEEIDTSQIGVFLANIMDPAKVDPTVLKWITFFTFALGIWAALSALGIKNGFLKILAFPFAFAMVYLLKPEEIFSALIGYSALGMTVLVVTPFAAIVFASAQMLKGRLTPPKIILQLMLWYFYLAFLIYFLVRALFIGEQVYSIWVLLIIAVGIIISLVIIVKNKLWRRFIARIEREGLAKSIEDVQHAVSAKESGEAERIARIARSANELYDRDKKNKDYNY